MEHAFDYAQVRPSLPGDEPALKKLWRAVFGDAPELVDAFFDILYAPGDACLALRGGELVSAGYCLPGAVAKGKKCSYIYAMATYPEHRGRGAAAEVAKMLTRRAFSSGADVVATLPATESLCAWYEKTLGMAPSFPRGGPGVVFPESWHRFAEVCGPSEGGAPDRLRAVCANGLTPGAFLGVGWTLTFD